MFLICSYTSSGKSTGRSYCFIIESISTPGSLIWPKTSIITPSGFLSSSPYFLISTTTLCPVTAPILYLFAINISCVIFLSSGTTKPYPFDCSYVPTILSFPLFITFTISHSALLLGDFFLFTLYITLSLCIAPFTFVAGTNMSSPCCLCTKPYPFECAKNVPISMPNDFGVTSLPLFVSTIFSSSKSCAMISSKSSLSSLGTLNSEAMAFLFIGIYSLLSK